jgi:hypothetical protein
MLDGAVALVDGSIGLLTAVEGTEGAAVAGAAAGAVEGTEVTSVSGTNVAAAAGIELAATAEEGAATAGAAPAAVPLFVKSELTFVAGGEGEVLTVDDAEGETGAGAKSVGAVLMAAAGPVVAPVGAAVAGAAAVEAARPGAGV